MVIVYLLRPLKTKMLILLYSNKVLLKKKNVESYFMFLK